MHTFLNNTLKLSSDTYDDPIVKLVNTITLEYIIKCILLIPFICWGLPFIGLILYWLSNVIAASMIVLYNLIEHLVRFGKCDVDLEKCYSRLIIWMYLLHKVWFGYSVVGLDNVPIVPACLLVSAHGPVTCHCPPLCWYWGKIRPHNSLYMYHAREAKGLGKVQKLLHLACGSKEECAQLLLEGNDLLICPGGLYESRYTTSEQYNLEWRERKGFAELAKLTQVPIIPVFTVNLNEAFWMPCLIKSLFRSSWSSKKTNITFALGGLPVKLTTLIGKPIFVDASMSAEEIVALTKKKIEELRDANQRLPGNKFQAVMDRFRATKYNTV